MKVVHFCGVLTLALLCLAPAATHGKKLALLPLTGDEVYRILYTNGYEDDIPEGRIVTEGIAAVSGLTAGLTKAIGGALLLDLTSTNITSLLSSLGGTTSSGSTSSGPQEICFNTRSARSLDEAETIAEAYMRMGQRATGEPNTKEGRNVRSSSGGMLDRRGRRNRSNRRSNKKRNNKNKVKKLKKKSSSRKGLIATGTGTTGTGTATGSAGGSGTTTGGATNSGTGGTTNPIASTGSSQFFQKPSFNFVASSPMTATTNPSATAGTSLNNGSGSGTESESTTSTGNGGATNCIVIEK